MDRYTLIISDDKLEQKYKFHRIKDYMKESRLIFLLLVALFGIFATLIGMNTSSNNINNYIRLAIFVVFFLVIYCAYLDRFIYQYYLFTALIISAFTLFKNVFEWWSSSTSLSLTTGLVTIVTTINLNISVVLLVITNSLNYVNYVVR